MDKNKSIARTFRTTQIATVAAMGIACLVFSLKASALVMTYTDRSMFMGDLPGVSTTLDFDGVAAGTQINSGDVLDGIEFDYTFSDSITLQVTDGNQFGGGGPFDTTSPAKFLGTDFDDVLTNLDEFSMFFNSVNAIGLSIITPEAIGISIFSDDIILEAGDLSAALDVGAVQQTLSDGSLVFFLGIINTETSITGASIINGAGIMLPDVCGEDVCLTYNIDDITTSVVPIPGAIWLFGSGLLGLIALRRRNGPHAAV